MTVEIVICPADAWKKVATNTTLKLIEIFTSGPSAYIQTTKPTGDPAPIDNSDAARIPSDGIISNSSGIDIYIKAISAAGSVRVSGKIFENVRQDNTSAILDIYLSEKLKEDIILTVPAVTNEFTLNVSPGHGFTGGGEWLEIWENGRFEQTEVESVLTNEITLALPNERVWTTDAVVRRVNIDLGVDGTTPKKFTFAPLISDWGIIRFILIMTHGSQGTDDLFGSLTALTNGVFGRRKNTAKGTYGNLFNAKSNADLRERGYDLEYSDKAGPSTFGTGFRRTFNGDDKNGAVVQVDGSTLEEVEAWVRDDLLLLPRFRIVLQGSATTG